MTTVQLEQPGDAAAIAAVHVSAFSTTSEADLVRRLRAQGLLTVSLVAVSSGQVVGHVAFSPVTVPTGESGVGLGPVAVLAEHRRQGVASAMIEAGLARCRTLGLGWCVVLGNPDYYRRFGFQPASQFGLDDDYGGGPAFGAMELLPGCLPRNAGRVSYSEPFKSLGC